MSSPFFFFCFITLPVLSCSKARAAAVACLEPTAKGKIIKGLDGHAAASLVATLAPRDMGATLGSLPEPVRLSALAGLPSKESRATAIKNFEAYGAVGDSGVALEDYEARRTTAETLVAMGPAKQALLLSSLPGFAGADLLSGLSTTARAAALRGVRVPAQRQALLDAMPEATRVDTELALQVMRGKRHVNGKRWRGGRLRVARLITPKKKTRAIKVYQSTKHGIEPFSMNPACL